MSACMCATACIWHTEDHMREPHLSLYYVGSRNVALAVRLGSKQLYLLRHFDGLGKSHECDFYY